MPDSQNPRNAKSTPPVRDPGHARAREISATRNAAKAHERTRTPDDARSGTGLADADRLRRRARFLRERNEAKELRERVQPRRARNERMRQALRMRTFRW